MPISIWDTLRDGKQPLEPIVPGRVGMYVCGMTVQAPPHVGHMRAYVVADLIRRVLRARGYAVTLVQNFTDIDDKIIAKAAEAGRDWREFAEQNIAAYFEAADWLSRHGSAYGLCQVFANEIWHYELATTPGGRCPEMLPDGSSRNQ